MRYFEISKSKRFVSGILAILLLSVMLFSTFYIAHEADHDCTGEGCPICACIQQCQNTLHQIGDGMAMPSAVVLPTIFTLLICLRTITVLQDTPVSRKVRLNN